MSITKRIVQDGQSIIDLVIQEFGSIEAVVPFCRDNNLGVSSVLDAGDEVLIDSAYIVKPSVVTAFKNSGVLVNTFTDPLNSPPIAINLDLDITGQVYTAIYEYFDADGDLAAQPKPYALRASFTGQLSVGQTLTGDDIGYRHLNGAVEGATTFVWQRADNDSGLNSVQFATTEDVTLSANELGKHIRRIVTPRTAGGETGLAVSSEWSTAVQAALVERKAMVTLRNTTTASYTPPGGETWNDWVLNSPTVGNSITNLKRIENVTITGLNLTLTSTMSNGNNLGISSAGRYPAQAARNFWYPASGERGMNLVIPSALQGRPFKIILFGATNNSGTNVMRCKVGGIEKTIANVEDNLNSVLTWDYAELDGLSSGGTISILSVDDTGFNPINVIEIYWMEPA